MEELLQASAQHTYRTIGANGVALGDIVIPGSGRGLDRIAPHATASLFACTIAGT